MSTDVARRTDDQWAVMEKVVVQGDLSKLSPAERVAYYRAVCESVGLNPLTQPFAYITLNGKLTLYALKGATDQIRATRHVALSIVSRERLDDVYVVTARATMPDGRTDEAIGAVTIAGMKGDALANALMKAETKAKRRVTLSVVGLGMIDESETETIRGAFVQTAEELGDGDVVDDVPVEGSFPDYEIDSHVRYVVAELRRPITRSRLEALEDEIVRAGIDEDPEIAALLKAAQERRDSRDRELIEA